jgi:glycosyltransferase involved in cell wall biosynthesis
MRQRPAYRGYAGLEAQEYSALARKRLRKTTAAIPTEIARLAEFTGSPSHGVAIVEPRVGHIGPNVEGMARLLRPIPVHAYGSNVVKSGYTRDNLTIEGIFKRLTNEELVALEAPDGSGCIEGLVHVLGRIGPADHLLFPGAVPPTLNALHTLLGDKPASRIPSIILRFFDVGAGGLPQNRSIAEVIARLRSSTALWGRIRIFTELPEQAEQVRRLWGVETDWFPHAPSLLFGGASSAEKHLEDAPFRIGFFGNSREEKGVARLPAIIRAFHQRAGALAGRVRWVVHGSGVGRDNEAFATLLAMARARPGRIEIITDALGQEAYDALFTGMDVHVLPYLAEPYRMRGSGIATEACYAGRPYVYTSGTVLGSVAGAAAIACNSAFAFADGLIEICSHYDQYSARARAAGQVMREQAMRSGYITALRRPADTAA